MEFTRKNLGDNIGLNHIKTDRFKSEALTVLFNSPLDKVRASHTALLMSVLMRGCNRFPTVQALSRRLDELYDASLAPVCFKRGENHICGFSLSCLKNKFAFDAEDIFTSCLDVLLDVITDPTVKDGVFDPEYVKCEKDNLISGIKAKKNDKISFAPAQCVKYMCGDEPFAVDESGDIDIISNITPRSLYEFYTDEFLKFGIQIFYVGTSPEPVCKFADKLFLRMGASDKYPFYASVVHTAPDDVKRITENEDVSQGKLSIGFTTQNRLSDGDYYKYTLFAEIFSNSPSSRLFKNVREKLSLCYYVRCSTDPHKGIAVVSLGIDNNKAKEAEDEILNQIDMLAKGDITPEDIQLAKLTVSAAYREIYDTASGMINWYYNRLCAGEKGLMIPPEDNSALIQGVTADDVAKCASALKQDTVYFMRGVGCDE